MNPEICGGETGPIDIATPSKLTEEDRAQFAAWIETLPEHVRAVATKYPMTRCYRSTEDPALHYTILRYSTERGPIGSVTLSLVHGRDSTRPGTATFGQPPEQLLPCDCGKWEPPTHEQVEATRRRFQTRLM